MSIWCMKSSISIYRTEIDRGTVVIVAKLLNYCLYLCQQFRSAKTCPSVTQTLLPLEKWEWEFQGASVHWWKRE